MSKWPKDRHAKRRLTSKQYFDRYNKILKLDGRVEFKTDNISLSNKVRGWKGRILGKNISGEENSLLLIQQT